MKRIFLSLFSLLLVASAIIVGGYWHDAYVAQPAPDAKTIAFMVQNGETLKSVATQLNVQGLLSNPQLFELYARLHDQAARLQAGTFQLKPGMSFQDLMAALSNAAAEDIQVTIPEGFTAAQIGEAVEKAMPSVTAKDWAEAIGPHSPVLADADLARALPPALSARGLEGYLFPDTYRFRPDATAEDVVHTFLFTFLQKTLVAGVKTDDKTVILASLLEREVQKPEDMKLVTDILFRRLNANMPLQLDSTVNYVTGGKYPAISTEDQAIDSPYNTYKYRGLPPGPISNPGLNALTAVLNPTKNEWLYFLTTSDGTVKYARTYDEHLANKAKYLK